MQNDKTDNFAIEHISDLALSFDGLPLIQRLEYVATLLCQRFGGDMNKPSDPTLAVAHGIVSGVIESLKDIPVVGQWDGREIPVQLRDLGGPR
jgi:hypothetical protein